MLTFFIFISIAMAISAASQFYIFVDLKDACDANLTLAPMIAGISLTVSFFFCFLWLRSNTKKVAIVIWSTAVIVGTVAAGATLGQIQLYPELNCNPALNYNWIQLISIALLIISICLPHGMPKREVQIKPIKKNKEQKLRFV